jgi:hypothetical protein
MRRTIQVIAAGAAMWCVALSAQPARADDGEPALRPADETSAAPLVESVEPIDFSPADDDAPAFVWATNVSLAPPPSFVRADAESYFVPPSASAPAVPLPAGVWTGFASLAGLGAIAAIRRWRGLR